MQRILVVSDFHSGHRAGLTPPGWQYQETDTDKDRRNFSAAQRHLWEFYTETVDSLKPVDVLVVNGDAIDGKGDRSGGTEIIEGDRMKQCEMAAEAISYVKAKSIVIVYGTQYHTGKDEDFEAILGGMVGAAKVGGHEWLDSNGVIFDFKHFVSGSIIPHGRYTSMSREALWNALWAEKDLQPRANVLVRSHVHYHRYAGEPGCLAMTTPALQGFGSKFGVRMCSGLVDIGMVHFDTEEGGRYRWQSHLLQADFLKVQPLNTSDLISRNQP